MLIRPRLNLLTPYCAILLFLACVNHASAQGQIDDATLMEAGQKTPEISTTELRRICTNTVPPCSTHGHLWNTLWATFQAR